MAGITGNIYCGLHEYSEMGFLLHFLRPEDTFCDIGANIGSFTVLASGVVGARTIAFEPGAESRYWLDRNIDLNGIRSRCDVRSTALSNTNGEVWFSTGRDVFNQVIENKADGAENISATRLDDALDGIHPIMLKIDVEGHEPKVLEGAADVLRDERLKAVSIETCTAEIESCLIQAGFTERFYDPRERQLSSQRPSFLISNRLFIRDEPFVLHRVSEAPTRSIYGIKL